MILKMWNVSLSIIVTVKDSETNLKRGAMENSAGKLSVDSGSNFNPELTDIMSWRPSRWQTSKLKRGAGFWYGPVVVEESNEDTLLLISSYPLSSYTPSSPPLHFTEAGHKPVSDTETWKKKTRE